MVHTLADDFTQEVARLCRVEGTHSRWEAFLDAHIPRHDNNGTAGGRFEHQCQDLCGRRRRAGPQHWCEGADGVPGQP